jgi:hypothetical protein
MKFDTAGNGIEESGRVGSKELKPFWEGESRSVYKGTGIYSKNPKNREYENCVLGNGRFRPLSRGISLNDLYFL